jgi:hypothetical protein
MKFTSKFSEEEIDRAVALYNSPMSASSVQKLTGMSYGSVIRFVKKRGFKPRTPREGQKLVSKQLGRTFDSQGRPLKICTSCGIPQLESEFGKAQESFDGLRGTCNTCRNKKRKEKYPEERDKLTQRQRNGRKNDPIRFRGYDMKKRFGVTWEEFDRRFAEQGNKCAGCGTTESGESSGSWHIDHDHACCPLPKRKTCGKCIRGILCRSCNLALGNARDDVDRLRGLATYLENYQKNGPGEKG